MWQLTNSSGLSHCYELDTSDMELPVPHGMPDLLTLLILLTKLVSKVPHH